MSVPPLSLPFLGDPQEEAEEGEEEEEDINNTRAQPPTRWLSFGGASIFRDESQSQEAPDSWTLSLGSLAGVPISVHASTAVFVLFTYMPFSSGGWFNGKLKTIAFALVIALSIRLVLSILMHELGHALAAIHQGGSCHAIVLNAAGGRAACSRFSLEHPPTRGSVTCANICIDLAGPAAGLLWLLVALAILASKGLLRHGWPTVPFENEPNLFFNEFWRSTYTIEAVLLVINVIPCIPGNDGSHVVQEVIKGTNDSPAQNVRKVYRMAWAVNVVCLLGLAMLYLARVGTPQLLSIVWIAAFWYLMGASEYREYQRAGAEGGDVENQERAERERRELVPGASSSSSSGSSSGTRIVNGMVVHG